MRLSEDWMQAVIAHEIEGIEVVDLQEAGNRARRILRVFVDHPDGVTHDMCVRVSDIVSSALDEINYSDGPYSLEVSSPGIERVLKKPAHFRAQVGKKVYVKTSVPLVGRKVWQGILREVREDSIVVVEGTQEVEIEFANVANAHLVFEFK
jgi:ribosome maturation factor RimP